MWYLIVIKIQTEYFSLGKVQLATYVNIIEYT